MRFKKSIQVSAVVAAMAIASPFVGGWEGLRNAAYVDPVGVTTICYGHTKNAVLGQVKTDAECDYLLKEELRHYAEKVDVYVTQDLPSTRLAALASFSYNVGLGAFRRSTLLRKLNAGDVIGACNELLRWDKATVNGKKVVLRGLTNRRAEERALCLMGTSNATTPI